MKYRQIAIYFGLILFLTASFLIRLNLAEKPKIIPRNGDVTLVATVLNQPRFSERSQIIEIGDSRLFVALYPKYSVGDRLRVKGFVDEQGRIFNAKVDRLSPRLQNGKESLFLKLKIWVANLRNRIGDNINELLPSSEAALVKGMVLGVDEIGAGLRDRLTRTGTIHVVVVSGQNLSIVAGLFLGLAGYIGRRLSLILATLAVFLYALLTGFEPPVVRASLMVLAGTMAVFWGRQSWPLLNLVLAALLILFIWPKALLEISFQLTFAATLGIMSLGQWLQRNFVLGPASSFLPAGARSGKNSKRQGQDQADLRAVGNPSRTVTPHKNTLVALFINNAAVATSAYLFTTPIIWWHFERVALISPIVNILVAELVAPMMILGFVVAEAGLIFMPLAQVLAYLAYIPAFVFIKVVQIFANF